MTSKKKSKKPPMSMDSTLAELVKKVKVDKSFPEDYVRLFVSKSRAPGVTVADCVSRAEEYAAGVLARRDTDDPSPDDPIAREAIAIRDSKAVAAQVLEDTEDEDKAAAQYETSLQHRRKATTKRAERAIAQHLAQYPEPSK